MNLNSSTGSGGTGGMPNVGAIMSIAYILGILVVLFVVYKVLSALGLIKTRKKKLAQAEKEKNVTEFRTMPEFNPQFKDTHSFKPAGMNLANLLAEKLHKAIHVFPWGTDEEAIYAGFGQLPSKGSISEVASQYYNRYNKDLRVEILNDMNEKEITKLQNIINTLPVL